VEVREGRSMEAAAQNRAGSIDHRSPITRNRNRLLKKHRCTIDFEKPSFFRFLQKTINNRKSPNYISFRFS